uniref:Uncharacterized protein n=1 Tax=Nicotiana tabacum TaxID=4097 RepID=A0A1S3ZR53_TOBAC|nr:PREDICTED: uncharacterized protein LOC107789661 [Nicotiana tabacum]
MLQLSSHHYPVLFIIFNYKTEHVEGAVGQENLPAHGDLYTHFQVAADEDKAVMEDINAQSPIHGVTVVAQTEQVIEEHDNKGADAQYVDLGNSEGSGVEKKGVTLDILSCLTTYPSWLSLASPYKMIQHLCIRGEQGIQESMPDHHLSLYTVLGVVTRLDLKFST